MERACYSALVIGFCLFLRKSNLVPDTQEGFNPMEQLTRQDVWQQGKLTMIEIRWSKTNQYRERDLLLPLIPARNKLICPVFWIKQLFKTAPGLLLKSPLFCYRKCGKVVPVVYDQLSKLYKQWVQKTGVDPVDHTLH